MPNDEEWERLVKNLKDAEHVLDCAAGMAPTDVYAKAAVMCEEARLALAAHEARHAAEEER